VELKAALLPFEKIRTAVGDRMDIMVEFHSLWQLPAAQRIARALADYDTFWHEDPVRMDSLETLKAYAPHSRAPICASETLAYGHAFRDYFATGVAGIAMLDLSWCGGLSEARKIAGMAEAWHVPVAPHDCTGPVVYMASCHFSLHARNALIQESVRAFYTGWYRELVTELPRVENGEVTITDAPGLGIETPAGRAEAARRGHPGDDGGLRSRAGQGGAKEPRYTPIGMCLAERSTARGATSSFQVESARLTAGNGGRAM
jgi:L-alanine-DL-glutamate epimerase-like enolase superfamily enzyme